MLGFINVILLWLVFASSVFAQVAPIAFDGELFTKKFVSSPPNGDKLLEYVRENESFEKWTKLVGYRYQQLPGLGNDPKKAAASMSQFIKITNPKASSRVIVDDKNDEALLDFVISSADQKIIELNIFRYAKSTDAKAVVSLQLAYRFSDSSPEGVEKFKSMRDAGLKHAIAFDMKTIQLAVAGISVPVSPENLTITLDDEIFPKRVLNDLASGDKQLRFVRDGETFEKWEKMVSFKRMSYGTDPKAVADRIAQTAMLLNGQAAQARVFFDEVTMDAYVDYKAWPEGNRFTEFNVYRITKNSDRKSVLALHLARRIPAQNVDSQELKNIRNSWLKQAHAFDVKSVFVSLGEK